MMMLLGTTYLDPRNLWFTLTCGKAACYINSVRRGLIQGGKKPWHKPGERIALGIPKGACYETNEETHTPSRGGISN